MTRPLSMDIRDRAMARLDANAPRASPGNVVSARPIQQAICDATRSCWRWIPARPASVA